MSLNTNQLTDKITPSTGTLDIVGAFTVNGSPVGGGGGPTNVLLTSEVDITTDSTYSTLTGLSFTAAANKVYLVRAITCVDMQKTNSGGSAYGYALALDIPSGSVYGIMGRPTSSTTATNIYSVALQTADAVVGAPGATSQSGIYNILVADWMVSVGGTGGTVQLTGRASNSFYQPYGVKANLSMLQYTLLN